MQPQVLLLIRHARAGQGAGTDAERPLTEQGARDAEAVGAWLAGRVTRPDTTLVSSARRARETWEAVCRGAGWDVAADLSDALYAAEPETALDLVRAVGRTGTVALVGHNPTMGTLAQLLDDGGGDTAAGEAMASTGFPPGAVAVLEHGGAWDELAWGSARLVAYRGDR
ncbi:MAG TPA: histidine phosphatase family protein [Nocardioides sp.]|nr:histidine phosphatase family protein [Nocardioides sp.]